RARQDYAGIPGSNPGSWSLLHAFPDNAGWANALFWASIVIFVLFALGVWPRLTAALTWVIVASFTENPGFEDEASVLLLILSFYLMVGHLFMGQRAAGRSLAYRILGPSLSW